MDVTATHRQCGHDSPWLSIKQMHNFNKRSKMLYFLWLVGNFIPQLPCLQQIWHVSSRCKSQWVFLASKNFLKYSRTKEINRVSTELVSSIHRVLKISANYMCRKALFQINPSHSHGLSFLNVNILAAICHQGTFKQLGSKNVAARAKNIACKVAFIYLPFVRRTNTLAKLQQNVN